MTDETCHSATAVTNCGVYCTSLLGQATVNVQSYCTDSRSESKNKVSHAASLYLIFDRQIKLSVNLLKYKTQVDNVKTNVKERISSLYSLNYILIYNL